MCRSRACAYSRNAGVMRGAERIGLENDRFRIVGNQHVEPAAEEGPRGLTRFNRAGGRFFERRIDEAIAGPHGGEDPRAKAPALAGVDQRQREPAHPARIDLQFLAGVAVEHRNRRRRPAKLQLQHREAVERGIRDPHALAGEQLANLGEADAARQPPPDRLALLGTQGPAIPARASPGGMECQQHVAHLLVTDRITVRVQAGRRRRLQISPHGLRIQPELGGHPFLREALAPESEYFLEFDHRDLAKHRCLLVWDAAQHRRPLSRGQARGERF